MSAPASASSTAPNHAASVTSPPPPPEQKPTQEGAVVSHEQPPQQAPAVYASFDDMQLKDELLRGVYGYGFEKPSQPQSMAIVPMMSGRDLICQAASGMGKSGAFLIGSLQRIDADRNVCQAIIVSPTRELAKQTRNVCAALAVHMGIVTHALVGGASIRDDLDILRDGVHVVSGTPGRILDMLSRKQLSAKDLRVFVVDEADEMLSRGFHEQITEIFQYLPEDVQLCLFSATLPPEVLTITEKFLRNPTRILINKECLTLEGW
jgi:translation initiation factor 4A